MKNLSTAVLSGGLRCLCIVLCMLLLLPASAQPSADSGRKIRVSGRVVDSKGFVIAGATVLVKNGSAGTVSDAQGNFQLTVPQGATLQVSFLGYESREISAIGGGKPLTVTLVEQTQQVDDVVVVGYGVQKKESVLGAISQVGTDELVNSGTANITQAITGKLSGITSIQTSGQPGNNDVQLYVRGVSSWNGSDPLVLVDGIERSFSDLDPNEVATISVLKDASATAVFGAKGANGVIIVTTRSGNTGKPKMNISLSYGLDFPTNIPDHVSSAKTAELLNVALKNTQSFGSLIPQWQIDEYARPSSKINTIRYPDTDWFDLTMRTCAQTITANYNVSGGSQRVKYFLSLGYNHEGSIFKDFSEWTAANFRYDRINYRSNFDFDVTKSTRLSVKVGGVLGIRQAPTGASVSGLFNMMYSASPMMFPAYYPAWMLDMVSDPDYPDASGERLASSKGSFYGNAKTTLSTGDYQQTTSNKLYTDLVFEQKLDFITKGLSLKANVSLSTYYSRVSQEASSANPMYYIDWDAYDSGEGNPWVLSTQSDYVYERDPYSVTTGVMQDNYYTTFYWEAALNYNRTFGDHTVTALALFNQRENAKVVDFPYHSQGLVARATYDYKHKYLFECNIGYTGSEQFSPKNRYGFFPSVAVGWVPSQERFWKQAMPWWSKMKIRYSDGLVGSDSAAERWLYYTSYVSDSSGNITEDKSANLEAQWEEARKRDLGIEMGWLDNRLTLNLDLFDEKRTNMLVKPNVTMLVGTQYKVVNRGSMKKHGIDIELGWNNRTKSGFNYHLTALLSLNENRITNYEDAPYAPDYQKVAGKAYMGQTGGMSVVDSGYYENVNDIHNYPAYSDNWLYVNIGSYKYLDYAVDGSLNSQDLHAIAGSQYPPVSCSFRGGFEYKGLEFSMLWTADFGKYVNYNNSWEIEFTKGDYRASKSQLDYWSPTNPDANHATLVFGGSSGHPMYSWAGTTGAGSTMMLEGRTWRKADYISLKEVYLGYTFRSKRVLQRAGFRNLSLYLTGTNLLTLSDLIEGDPKSTTFTTGFYPMMTSVKLGVKIGF